MIHKLIYTSAEKGLQPGSRGFCTVATTPGIPRPLIQALESLSTYRHVFSPGSGDAGSNPSVFSCLKMQAGPSRYTVLSRIEDAGSDYTGRSNFLARHLALETSDQVPAGPAWLMTRDDTFQTEWHGPPQILDQGKPLPAGRPPAAVCRTWQQIAGDAGWAGALAQTANRASKQQPVSIIVRPDMPLLELYVEALRLLPDRWSPTFSTYFTKLPPGVGCDWRMVWQDSPEAAAAKQANHLIFDLCGDLGSPPAGPLVDAARSGEPVGAAHMPAAPRGPAMPAMPSRQRATPTVAGDPFAPTAPVVAGQEPEAPSSDGLSAMSESDLAAGTPSDAPTSRRRRPPRRPRSGSRFLIWLVVIISLAATGALAYLIVPKLLQRDKDDKQPEVAKTNPSDTDGDKVEPANGGTQVTGQPNGEQSPSGQNGNTPNEFGAHNKVPITDLENGHDGNGTPTVTVSSETRKALDRLAGWREQIRQEMGPLKSNWDTYDQLGPKQQFQCLQQLKRLYESEAFRNVREFDFKVVPRPKPGAEQEDFVQLSSFRKQLISLGDKIESRQNELRDYSPFATGDPNTATEIAVPDDDAPITVLPLRLFDWRLLTLEPKAPSEVADSARPEFHVEARGEDGGEPSWNVIAHPAGDAMGESIGRFWLSRLDYQTELMFKATSNCLDFDLDVSVAAPFSDSHMTQRRTVRIRTQKPHPADVYLASDTGKFIDVYIPKERLPADVQAGGEFQFELKCPDMKGGEDLIIENLFRVRVAEPSSTSKPFWFREWSKSAPTPVKYEVTSVDATDGIQVLIRLWYGKGPTSVTDLIEKRFLLDDRLPRALDPDPLTPDLVKLVRDTAQEQLEEDLARKDFHIRVDRVRQLLHQLKKSIEDEPAKFTTGQDRDSLNQEFAFALLKEAREKEIFWGGHSEFVGAMRGILNTFGGKILKRHRDGEERKRREADEQFLKGLLLFRGEPHVTGALKWRPSDNVGWKTVVPLIGRVRRAPPAPPASNVKPDSEPPLKVGQGVKV